MGELSEYAKLFIGLLAIVNPIGMVPVFISLTRDHDPSDRRRVGSTASFTVVAVLVLSLLLGELILEFFGIGIPSFRVAGGMLIMLMALNMMHGTMSPAKQNPEEKEDLIEKQNIAVVPMGIPLLAGPGAISTMIIYSHRYHTMQNYLALMGVIVLVGVVCWLSLASAPAISRLMGKTGINIVTRIMGLIMAAISVEFIANGLKQLFPVMAS